MTKSIEEQREELAEKYVSLSAPEMTRLQMSWDFKNGFDAGAKARDEQWLKVVNELREALDKITKTDFAELKNKLCEFSSSNTRDYAEGLDSIQKQGATYTFRDGAYYQYTKSAAIISELIEIIKLQNIEVESYVRYIYCTETCHLSTRWSDHAKCTCGAEKLKNSVKSSLSETTTRLQKLREGKNG